MKLKKKKKKNYASHRNQSVQLNFIFTLIISFISILFNKFNKETIPIQSSSEFFFSLILFSPRFHQRFWPEFVISSFYWLFYKEFLWFNEYPFKHHFSASDFEKQVLFDSKIIRTISTIKSDYTMCSFML